MDLDQYDDFGNYIGPELEASSDESEDEEAAIEAAAAADAAAAAAAAGSGSGGGGGAADGELVRRGLVRMEDCEAPQHPAAQKPVPHELKQYYPTAAEVYPEAETLVQEEDLQPITEPIIAPSKQSDFDILEAELPETTFSFDYLASLMYSPQCVRNICLLGHLHSGKTTFVDMLVEETHPSRLPTGLSLLAQHVEAPHANKRHRAYFRRYTDSRRDEQKRGLSIKATPVSLVLHSSPHSARRTLDHWTSGTDENEQAAAAAAAAAPNLDPDASSSSSSSSLNGSSSSSSGSGRRGGEGGASSSSTALKGGRSFLFNILDTPGHVCFSDESSAAMRLCDGALFFVDALEGLQASGAPQLAQVIEEGLSLIVVINKLDRLTLELRLKPQDAYYKLKCVLDEINEALESICTVRGLPPLVISPHNRNLLFAMTQFSFVFSLDSFAALYFDSFVFNPSAKTAAAAADSSSSSSKDAPLFGGIPLQKLVEAEHLQQQLLLLQQQDGSSSSSKKRNQKEAEVDVHAAAAAAAAASDLYTQMELFAVALWGDFYRDPETHTIQTAPPFPDAPRMFVEFILEPLYKLLAHCVAEERPTLEPTLAELGIRLRADEYLLDSRTLLKRVLSVFFGDASSFVDCVVEKVEDPQTNGPNKVQLIYTGNQEGVVAKAMKAVDRRSNYLMIYTTKNYHRPNNYAAFDLLGRVMSGTVCKGHKVRVLGEAFSLDDDEDQLVREVTHLWIPEGRYRVEVDAVPAGSWVLIGGCDLSVRKTATITSADMNEEVEIFKPLSFYTTPVLKIACEPLQPSELPKMIEGLRRIDKAYPIAQTKVEESGEHVICGTGELYLDCLLHDLRNLYGKMEIKVSDPVVKFCETVVETSALKCFAESPNKKNKLYMVAEPLEKRIADDLEKGLVSDKWDQRTLGEHFSTQYGWDLLASRSIWAFGPSSKGSCVLLGEVFNPEFQRLLTLQKGALLPFKESVVQGFQWATREGPLIEENVKAVRFKLVDAEVAKEPIHRGGGQIIPSARRVAYSALLLATPRLLEPILFAEIQCPADCVSAIYTVLARRRGNVARDMPKPGTPLYLVQAYLPAIESFGFETDLRTHTSGQAMCFSVFDNWAIVPGDPLDKQIVFKPLEPAPAPHLAREFLLKTRRRKGLSEDVSIHKFFDDPMLLSIANNLQQFL
ncbi:hypothetical protein Esti_002809 [Eimeria stiedai]